jgi:hypothetical protein
MDYFHQLVHFPACSGFAPQRMPNGPAMARSGRWQKPPSKQQANQLLYKDSKRKIWLQSGFPRTPTPKGTQSNTAAAPQWERARAARITSIRSLAVCASPLTRPTSEIYLFCPVPPCPFSMRRRRSAGGRPPHALSYRYAFLPRIRKMQQAEKALERSNF